jgi:hypothetical protein
MNLRQAGVLKTRLPIIVLLGAIFVFVFTNLVSYLLFGHIPHINDEIGYLFQAKIFALGKLYAPSPCGGEAFNFPHVINNGRWYSQYPPGFPAILLFGLIVGAPWLVNPLLAALSVIVFYVLGREIYGEAEGRLTAVLGSFSIWFLLTSSTMLSHTSSMLLFSLFLLFLFKSLRSPTLGNGIAAGLSLGGALLIRPYTVAAISVPLVLYLALRSIRRPGMSRRNLAGFVALLLVAIAGIMIYNQLTNGHPLKMGYVVRYGEAHNIGFGRAGYGQTPHTPGMGAFLIGKNLAAINKYLFGWPLTSLLFLIPFVFPLGEDRKRAEADLLIVASFVSLAAGLFFYWGSYVFLGARMFFESLPLLLLMTSRGILKTPSFFKRFFPRAAVKAVKIALAWTLALLMIFGFGFTFPRWLKPPHSESYAEIVDQNFRGVTDRINRALTDLQLGKSLVIMKFLYSPRPEFPDGLWGSGFLYNDPLLRNTVIYAKDRGLDNLGLFACYPERRILLYVGTVEKGMLTPLELVNGRLNYGEPILGTTAGATHVRLVARPQDVFYGYSPAYQAHLDALFAKLRLSDSDVADLSRFSQQAARAHDFVSAAYFLESALQLENDMSVRGRLLAQLAAIYFRTGDRAEAMEIIAKLHDFREPRVYDVLPAKGF